MSFSYVTYEITAKIGFTFWQLLLDEQAKWQTTKTTVLVWKGCRVVEGQAYLVWLLKDHKLWRVVIASHQNTWPYSQNDGQQTFFLEMHSPRSDWMELQRPKTIDLTTLTSIASWTR